MNGTMVIVIEDGFEHRTMCDTLIVSLSHRYLSSPEIISGVSMQLRFLTSYLIVNRTI